MTLAFIWAQDEAGTIGLENKLPWHLPNDLRFFKEKTLKQVIVMGRKTFEGMGKRALPGRKTIVLTTDLNYQADQVAIMHSKEEVLAFAKEYEGITYITGGANIYQLFLEDATLLYRTVIHEKFLGDTVFPKVNWEEWQLVEKIEGQLDEKNKFAHSFEKYERNA
ncbi:dihydrofolate reductase [Isobaculum melis]|uniref:Dihydrofolate reductase n=1 Tax=Isobaculum melis TaxID=142588 RepID=A0A1H9RWK4_9LACT|nr:dihydrofolate reductase [Isobaculum melis]SER77156.1 dihydrofolate reductase [Isobaculum melis]